MLDGNEIMAVLAGIERDFSKLDFDAWLSHFHANCLIMSPELVVTPTSASETAAIILPLMERLRAQSYARSSMVECTVKLLSETTALAGTLWRRLNGEGDEIESLAATYAFLKDNGAWKITVLIVHPAETVLRME